MSPPAMLIQTLAIRNFRSCEDVVVDVERLTAIVGANGCGKSAVLRALDLFYAPTPKFGPEDFYAHDTSRDIELTLTFGALSAEEREKYAPYLEGNQLSVTRVLSWREGRPVHRLHGSRLRYGRFSSVRTARSAGEAKKAYQELKATSVVDLPVWSSREDALAALSAWEEAHPDLCERARDEGAFFGFKEVGQGYLGRSTRLLFIPAVRDAASDAHDGKGSVIADLMDLVVRRTLAEHPDYRRLVDETKQRYQEVFDPAKFGEVGALSGRLTTTLKTYVPDAAVSITWEASAVDLPLPRASVRVAEDGFATNIAACGHGLQRAFILTLLQHLAAAQPNANDVVAAAEGTGPVEPPETEPIPDLVLVIEEPELFQHPSRQRHFAEMLRRLASESIPGVARRAQVIYCTHSPHFVGIDRFDQVRIFQRVPHADSELPKITQVRQAKLPQIARRLANARDENPDEVDGEGLRARLTPLMTPGTSEGFFADVAVLVEGEGDRAAILATAESLDVSLDGYGVAVIPCTGKSNVLNVAAVFQEFGVATFCLWDGDAAKGETEGNCAGCGRSLDKKAEPKENHRLLRLHGAQITDFPAVTVDDAYACFHNDLETTLESEIGKEAFTAILDQVKANFGLGKRAQAKKNPKVLSEVLRTARANGLRSETLEMVVQRITARRAVGVGTAAGGAFGGALPHSVGQEAGGAPSTSTTAAAEATIDAPSIGGGAGAASPGAELPV